jgi:hypothetical protein
VDQPEVVITQRELAEISDLEREVAWRAKKANDMKSSVKAMLMSHIRVEPGRFDAKLRKQFGRSVPWKSFVVEKLGQPMADWFKKLHPVHVRFDVDVVEHAVEPLWKGRDDRALDIN